MQSMAYTALLSCISAVLAGREQDISLPSELDRGELLALAKKHYLVGFLHRICYYDGGMPAEVKEQVVRAYFAALAQQTEQERFAEELFAFFGERQIRYMPMKGHMMRRIYPALDLRMSCDLDVYFDPQYRDVLRKWVLSQGFVEEEEDVHNDAYTRGNLNFEAHHSLSESDARERAYYANIWERCVTEDGLCHRFTDEDFYLYMLLHTRKHFYEGNIGVRAVLDIHIYRTAHPHMDEGYLAREAEVLSLTAFAATMERLARVWFEGGEEDADMATLGDYVMEGGVRATGEQHILMRAANNPRGGKIRYLLALIFPNYTYMARYFKFLRRCPILLPFAWVGRWFRILFSHGKQRRNHLSDVAALDRDALARTLVVRRIAEGEEADT